MTEQENLSTNSASADENMEFNENGDLINSEKAFESVAYLDADNAGRLVDFLRYSGINDAKSEYNEISDSYNVLVTSKEFDKAQNLFHVFSENELDNEDNETNESITSGSGNIYESSTEKYKDNLSSAITFFICGTIGLIILLLNNLGVFSFINTSGASGILMNIVLGGLFIGFIVIAVISLRYSKKIKSEVSKEEATRNDILSWITENITTEKIEASYNNDIPEEMKYFSRSEYVKNAIKIQYPELDEKIIETISDDYIESIFNN